MQKERGTMFFGGIVAQNLIWLNMGRLMRFSVWEKILSKSLKSSFVTQTTEVVHNCGIVHVSFKNKDAGLFRSD